jgi:hypothetical protein
MQQLKSMLAVLPEEMSADANVALTADDKVQAALRDCSPIASGSSSTRPRPRPPNWLPPARQSSNRIGLCRRS